jgi:hypothetical protein
VYNSETNAVEKSIHVRFNDKEPDKKVSELVESFAEFGISSSHSEPENSSVEV